MHGTKIASKHVLSTSRFVRKPNWVEEDISEDDLHREAGGDPVEL